MTVTTTTNALLSLFWLHVHDLIHLSRSHQIDVDQYPSHFDKPWVGMLFLRGGLDLFLKRRREEKRRGRWYSSTNMNVSLVTPHMSGNVRFWNHFQRFEHPPTFHWYSAFVPLIATHSTSLEWCDANGACKKTKNLGALLSLFQFSCLFRNHFRHSMAFQNEIQNG